MTRLTTVVQCPMCGHAKEEAMAEGKGVDEYECGRCGKVLTPLPGECCVYCSWGTVKCPKWHPGPDCDVEEQV